jgi:trimethylamine--corrinoid protein Co-methyltransferase
MAQPTLRILDDDELTAIHAGSLEVLERIGMRIEHTGARELLAGAGAKVDATTGVVRFPSVLVEEKLALVPRTLDYHGRSPAFDFTHGSLAALLDT